MKNKAPRDRRKFAGPWDEIGYLYDKLLFWLYQRQNPKKARRYAERLERLLPRASPDHSAVFGEECWALVHETKGNISKAIQCRHNEIRLIRRLHELSRNTPNEKTIFKHYDLSDLRDRLDLLAILYYDNGQRDKAIATLQESKKLCQTHRIRFDGYDLLKDYLDEERSSHGQVA